MRESPQETLSRLGPYSRYPDFCTIQVDQRKGGFESGAPTEGADKEASHLFLRVRSLRRGPGSNMGHFADK